MSYIGNSPSANRLRFNPQATQPTNAQEGDIYYDDGTNRQEGLYQFKDTAWVLVGSGTNDSIVQYITNGDAETGVTSGWATYADAAGVAPVDGTGGVANVTIAASATAPLRGEYSFLLTKDANDRQGQGWSYDFSINDADKAKVLTINFDYVVNSGTFAAGSNSTLSDVVVYIYDVTNNTLIQPSSIKLFSNSSTISDVFEAQFQTSATGSDYRLILHVASTSASAYELKVDNVRVSPSQYVFGTPITDWQTFTPTISTGTHTNIDSKWRRVGDSIEVRIYHSTSSAGSGLYSYTLPSGLVADTTKVSTSTLTSGISTSQTVTSVLGTAHYRTGTITNYSQGIVVLSSSNQIQVLLTGAASSALSASGNAYLDRSLGHGSATAGVGTSATSMHFFVPISGFSSSVQTSDNADTRVVAFAATTSTTSATANVTPINFTSILGDTHGAYSAGTYTVPVSGWYKINGQTYTAAAHTAYIYIDGVSVAQGGNVGSAAQASEVNALRPLTAGQTIQIRIDASQTISGGAVINRFSVERVTGPSAIAATETVAARFLFDTTSAPGAGAYGTVNILSAINDSHGMVDVVNEYIVIPTSGIYNIGATYNFVSTTFGAGGRLFMGFSVNGGSDTTIVNVVMPAATAEASINGSTGSIKLNAGDIIRFRLANTTNTNGITNTSFGWVHRVGL